MPAVRIQAGAEVEIPSRDEIRSDVAAVWELQELTKARGVKWMYLPEILTGTPASSALTLGITKGQVVGPEQGYIWMITRLVVSGLTSGTTPDVMNLYRSDRFAGPPMWQFNGNNFAYVWGKFRMTFAPGNTLNLQNVGNLAATGVITVGGELLEVPAEMAGKLA